MPRNTSPLQNTKNKTAVKLTAVSCAPVVEVKIKRPDTKYQLGFSVQNGVVSRGGPQFKKCMLSYMSNYDATQVCTHQLDVMYQYIFMMFRCDLRWEPGATQCAKFRETSPTDLSYHACVDASL